LEQPDFIALLKAFALNKKKRIKTCQLYDSNVSTSTYDESTPWIVHLTSGYIFSHQIHMTHHRRRVHIAASEEYISLRVEGRLDVGKCSINRPNRVSFVDVPSAMRVCGEHLWPVFVPRWAEQNPALSRFLDLPSVHAMIGQLIKSPKDSVHIFQDAILTYFRPGSVESVQSAIASISELVGVRTRMSQSTLCSLPENLQPLVPLIQKWAQGDDSWREELLERASKASIMRLIETVSPYLIQINEYLGANDDEATCALGRLAEVTVEAQHELGNREK
jgi:hypothetical protein